MQKMIYVDKHMETLIENVSRMTEKPFSRIIKEALILWIEKHNEEPNKDPVELLYEAIEILKRR